MGWINVDTIKDVKPLLNSDIHFSSPAECAEPGLPASSGINPAVFENCWMDLGFIYTLMHYITQTQPSSSLLGINMPFPFLGNRNVVLTNGKMICDSNSFQQNLLIRTWVQWVKTEKAQFELVLRGVFRPSCCSASLAGSDGLQFTEV